MHLILMRTLQIIIVSSTITWLASAQTKEDPWQMMPQAVAGGFIPTEEIALSIAREILSVVYHPLFVDESSYVVVLEKRQLDEVWNISGVLTGDESKELQLLVVLERYSGRIIGITNFTKEQSIYTKFLIRSSKKGYITTKAMAITMAELFLKQFYLDDFREQMPLKAKLKDGIWYINGSGKATKEHGIAMIKIRQSDGAVLGFRHYQAI
ncbi:NTF2 fold immunity protein [Entomospira entomophila]|uniref:NTF2 fold domain-containing protein n=1 Tax=Entomospira entomophila TaxID=2719988 RepID=A0A968KU24_9SPIO|nr:NTF2 fold immunity protein [Entomospira entomophilus]NIZ40996.1 hypothetical protein [Entomospira entomophilus]WDI35209.1 NTF2 fold immunity protein [Entomospira entomophilus]